MKIVIVGIQNIKHMTTVSVYTDIFKKSGIEYDLIYMDKYGIDEKNNAQSVYKFTVDKKKYSTPIGKFYEIMRFRKFAIDILKREKYDFVILWREYAVYLFSSYVYQYYAGKYTVNIRDLWNKKNVIMTYFVKKALKKSAFNTVCSDGFMPHIPKAKYLFLHCINYDAIDNICNLSSMKNLKKPLVITYIGALRYIDYCFKVVDVFANDDRFEIRFIGQGSEAIQVYANENNYNNVICKGAFEPDNTVEMLEGTDIVNCAYGAISEAERALLPTRFYYAIYLGIPILNSAETWLQKKANELCIGITLPSDLSNKKPIADMVYESYMKMDFEIIQSKTKKYIKEIEETTKNFELKLLEIIE